jgi:hypothetical protein
MDMTDWRMHYAASITAPKATGERASAEQLQAGVQ